MAYTIGRIASEIGAEAHGDLDIEVDGVAEPAEAGPRHLAMAATPRFLEQIGDGSARAAFIAAGADWRTLGVEAAIVHPRPRYAMSGLTRMMDEGEGWEEGVHPSAVVHKDAVLGQGVSIGPLSFVGAGARIGDSTAIGPQCHVGANARIGAGSLLREGVRIAARVSVGARFIAQPGVTLGGDGFSFVTPDTSDVESARQTLGGTAAGRVQKWERIHSLGDVEIGDDVEMGANSTVDRGTVRATRVGDRTKIDNFVAIGHNAQVGRDCLLCAHSGVAGSTKVGDNVVLGGMTGVTDNIFVGDNVITGGGTRIMSNVPAGRVMLGYPAMRMDAALDVFKRLRRLGRLFDDVAELKRLAGRDR